MTTPKDEAQFRDAFAQLDDDLQVRLLQSLGPASTAGVESPEAPGRSRIHQQVFARLGLHRVPRRSRTWRWVAAAVSGAALFTAVVPNPVSAALKDLLSFIPGIGIVQSSPGSTALAVLPQPVHGTWDGAPIQVMGVMMTSHEMLMTLSGTGGLAPSQVVFRTTGQAPVILHYSRWDGTGSTWSGDYYATGRFGPVRHHLSGTIIIGGEHLPVTLDAAEGVRELSQLGPTQTHHGVTLTAFAARWGTLADLTIVPTYHGPFTIWNVTPTVVDHGPGITIASPHGHVYPTRLVFNLGPNNQFTFTPALDITRYRVTVPRVDATYWGQATVTLPVPRRGSIRLDKTVLLAGFPITITKVSRVRAAYGNVRVDLNLHASLSQAQSLNGFEINGANEAKIDPKTGAFVWIEVRVGRHTPSITWHLSNAEVYIRGPWVFNVTVPRPPAHP